MNSKIEGKMLQTQAATRGEAGLSVYLGWYIADNAKSPHIGVYAAHDVDGQQDGDFCVQWPLPGDEDQKDTLERLVIGCVNRANESPSASVGEALRKAASHGFSRNGNVEESVAVTVAEAFIQAAASAEGKLSQPAVDVRLGERLYRVQDEIVVTKVRSLYAHFTGSQDEFEAQMQQAGITFAIIDPESTHQGKLPETLVSDAERMQQIHEGLAQIESEGAEMAQREATPREIADLNVRRANLQAERARIVYRRTHHRTPDAAVVQSDIEGKLEKSAGQLAYERDLAALPNYDDGARRPGWDQLGDVAKASWERNPTDRKLPEHAQELVERGYSVKEISARIGQGFALAARRSAFEDLGLLSFHSTQVEAIQAMNESSDARNLSVVPATVHFAANGNVRLWHALGVPVAERKLPQAESTQPNEKAYEAAARAVDKHTDYLGIEGDREIQVWHLLASLHEFCAVNGVDLDAQIADVRKQIMTGEIQSPAWVAAHSPAKRDDSQAPGM